MSVFSNMFIIILLLNSAYSQCTRNTLVLDEEYEQICKIGCNQCLKHINIDLDTLIMTTFQSHTVSACPCPSYKLQQAEHNHFRIYEGERANAVGSIGLNDDQNRIKLILTYWMQSQLISTCNQYYVPNTNDFMTVSSYQAFSIDIRFDHGSQPLYDEDNNKKSIINKFNYNVTNYLNWLFNVPSLFTVQLIQTSPDPYSYKLQITSTVQLDSIGVFQIRDVYNDTLQTATDGIMDIISDIFHKNTSNIDEFIWSYTLITSHSSMCGPYFETQINQTTISNSISENPDKVPYLIACGVLLCIIIIGLVIYNYKRKRKHSTTEYTVTISHSNAQKNDNYNDTVRSEYLETEMGLNVSQLSLPMPPLENVKLNISKARLEALRVPGESPVVDDGEEYLSINGDPPRKDYKDVKVKLECSEQTSEETWVYLCVDSDNKTMDIGFKQFEPTEIGNISRDTKTIYIEDVFEKKYEIICESIEHATWVEKQISLFKKGEREE